KPLKFHNRIRAGLTVLYLQKQKNYKKLESTSAVDWLNKYAGKQVYEIIWEPLLRGKFDTDYKDVSMAWLWARVSTRANSRIKGKGEQLGYFIGGFKKFTDSLVAACKKNGVNIYTNTKVDKLLDGPKLVVNGQQKTFDQIIVTTATNTFLKLIPQNYKDYAAQLAQVKYLDALLIVFSSNQDLSNYYWHNVNDKNIPFLVFIQHTNLVSKDLYGGKNVYYIATYLNKDSKYLTFSPQSLQKQWFSSLKKMYSNFDEAKISDLKVVHLKDAQHIVDTKYTSYVPSIKTPINNVYLSNFSQIYPEDRGVNYAIRAGQETAKLIENDK
ncbi:MAG: FAD-dependent oxidoreductase, partial [Candidatus Saccharibacteria bacterium]